MVGRKSVPQWPLDGMRGRCQTTSEIRMTKDDRPQTPVPWLANLTETFGLSRGAAIAAIVFVSGVVVASVAWFIYSSPPRTLTITAGRPGSTFERNAEAYQEILARDGVTLNILRSEGSMQNLEQRQP